MELTQETVSGLVNIQDASLPEEAFSQILESVVSRVCMTNDTNSVKLLDSKPILTKNAFAHLSCLLAEAARHDLDEENFQSFLATAKLSGPRAKKIVDAYVQNKKAIQTKLEVIGNNPPHIVDIDWRLDRCVKSDTCDSIGLPLYHIRLTVWEHREKKYITFTCTIQQLQDLVSKLKDAARHLEKLTNI